MDMTTRLVVILFENPDDAHNALADLKKLETEGQIEIDDYAIVKKDLNGKVDVDKTAAAGAKKGAVVGGLLGLILAGLFFPIAGIAIGAAGGALIGKMSQLGIDKEFIQEVVDKLQPGNSALFVTGQRGAAEVAIRAMDPYRGTVYHTNLDEEVEEQLRQALK
jgi:uncharacterized membrane protein